MTGCYKERKGKRKKKKERERKRRKEKERERKKKTRLAATKRDISPSSPLSALFSLSSSESSLSISCKRAL